MTIDGLTPETRRFFSNLKKDDNDIDEAEFDLWKTELQKDLPEFWTTLNQKFTK